MKKIVIKGAREHNLKNIDLEIPKNKLVVFTGVSGSGKSSLALDTIYAEGKRRYTESLSSYARQFLGVETKPDVDQISGLSPAIAISQKKPFHNPRSTVGTITEIYDYLRLLFARIGDLHCPVCKLEIKEESLDGITASLLHLLKNKFKTKRKRVRVVILAPLVKDKKGAREALLENLLKEGYLRARIDSNIQKIEERTELEENEKHTIEAVVDRISFGSKEEVDELESRVSESLSQALELSDGEVVVLVVKDKSEFFPENPKEIEEHLFSQNLSCPKCGRGFSRLEPRDFSFNSPHGACPECEGLGTKLKADSSSLFNPRLSINEGGILALPSWLTIKDNWYRRLLKAFAKEEGIDLNKPIGKLAEKKKELLTWGKEDKDYLVEGRNRKGRLTSFREKFLGIANEVERRYKETSSKRRRTRLENYLTEKECPLCHGTRLKPKALSVTVSGKNIGEVNRMNIEDAFQWSKGLLEQAGERKRKIAVPITRELKTRLKFLNAVGLSYLTLDRAASTLSGGEAQRIRLASQIGSGLSGVVYVLDEPSVGLHDRDMEKLIRTLKELRDLDNTVIVVEHDQKTIESADWVVDFGLGGGRKGGEIITSGPPEEIAKDKKSLTGKYLAGKKEVSASRKKENETEEEIILKGASQFNLKDLDVSFPLGNLICVTGVSGSGKSTLVFETFLRALKKAKGRKINKTPGKHEELIGTEKIDKIYEIDQSPIGRTPRSNPATYTKAFDYIRKAFARTKEARIKGFDKSYFSFNTDKGRCDACGGQGEEKIEMQFLADVYVPCEVCNGKRYNKEVLGIKYRGKNIAEVLDMTVEEALSFFSGISSLTRRLQTLADVGLDYITLGQSAPTLSGGEAQRIRLAKELSKRPMGNTFYFLDEPTIGLHPHDLVKLLKVLRRLVERGNTVLIIEHNLNVIRSADHIIDLGPEGGEKGGSLVCAGTPEEVAANKKSYTGKALKKVL